MKLVWSRSVGGQVDELLRSYRRQLRAELCVSKVIFFFLIDEFLLLFVQLHKVSFSHEFHFFRKFFKNDSRRQSRMAVNYLNVNLDFELSPCVECRIASFG